MSYTFDRSLEFSIITYLQTLVPVPVIDDSVEQELDVPTVVVSCSRKIKRPFQHGSQELDRYSWDVYIYANNKAERDYLTAAIYDNLECGIPVTDLETTPLGSLIVEHITASFVIIPPETLDKLRYRTLVSFDTIFQEA